MIASGQREPAIWQPFMVVWRTWLDGGSILISLLILTPLFIFLASMYMIWIILMADMSLYAVLLGSAFLVLSGTQLIRARLVLQRWDLAHSTVTRCEESDSQSYFCYTLAFQTKTEQPAQHTITFRHILPLDLAGAFILYHPAKPTAVKLFAFGPIWGAPLTWAWIGWGCIYAGGVSRNLPYTFTWEGITVMMVYTLALPLVVKLLAFICFYGYRHARLRREELV